MTLEAILVGSRDRNADVRNCLKYVSIPIAAEFSSADQCLESLPFEPDRKRLFAVDVGCRKEVDQLEQLSKAYRAPCLALMDAAPSGGSGASEAFSLWQQVLLAGACQIATRPVNLEELEKSIGCIKRLFDDPTPECKIIAVTGATGGSGATTMAINLAHELTHLTDSDCILSELEGRMGMLASYLDLRSRHTLADLTQMDELDADIVAQTLVPFSGRMNVLCGGNTEMGAPTAAPQSAENLDQLITSLRSMCQFLVLDVSSTLTPNYFDLLSKADEVVIVAEQTLPSMRNLRLLQDSLRPMQISANVDIVVNKFDRRVVGFSLPALKDLVGTKSVWTVESDTSTVTGAINVGRPLRMHAPRSTIVQEIGKVVRAIATRSGCTTVKPPEKNGLFSFLKRLA